MTTKNPTQPPLNPLRQRARWIVIVVAMAAAVATWTVAVPLLGIDLVVDLDGTPHRVGQLDVIVASLLSGTLGWMALSLLEWAATRRQANWPVRGIWITIAALVLLVSLAGTLSATTMSALLVLLALHLVTGLVLIVGLPLVRGRRP